MGKDEGVLAHRWLILGRTIFKSIRMEKTVGEYPRATCFIRRKAMDIGDLHRRLDALKRACASHGATGWAWQEDPSTPCLDVAGTASADDVERIERQLAQQLPPSLRNFFVHTSRRVAVGWFLPKNVTPPQPCSEIFASTTVVDLAELVPLQARHHRWVEACFQNPADPYDTVWHHKLPILHVANGDLIAIEIGKETERVCYLSHDGSEMNGFVLGESFDDYLDRFSKIGFVGPEDWQWRAFVGEGQRIDPHGAPAQVWREWFGLRLPAGEA